TARAYTATRGTPCSLPPPPDPPKRRAMARTYPQDVALQEAGPSPEDVEPCEHETVDRLLTGTVTVVPFLMLGVVGWQLWADLLGWSDLLVFVILYVATGIGITVGYHRLFTHRSFRTTPAVRAVFAVLGSAALEGPVVAWVADHRKHHAFSDRPG